MNPAAIEYACLEAGASETTIRKLCEDAWIRQFGAIAVAPTFTAYAKEMLEFCPFKINIITVAGFPFGYSTTRTKLAEADEALTQGADEIQVSLNISQFKSMAYLSIREELRQLAVLVHDRGKLLTVCIETGLLDSFDLYTACELCTEASTDFVKTASGFFPADHGIQVVSKIRSILPANVRLSVFNGPGTTIQELLDAGANRVALAFGNLPG
ncbi:deoxyribose-phosphate aldolase [Dyadobacter sandarakinus]|uniref:Deoxyribose-phosphate aldolase n=1 Tax=Dyadobacter sandarakinus TaxID=2747268 RepID=A0ABX7IC21_9BACT|nr:deoxyribose-phosphate aldolase [Dyadobacter sandarakinus]QRR02688.1 deoxyribose-phosphate aldolase [Dyadobacter sandarakinus]